ncbi:MAG: COR domain-containing protein [Sulfuricurvum sp.]
MYRPEALKTIRAIEEKYKIDWNNDAQRQHLTELDLRNNFITDISPLARLTQLTHLNLWSNQITDLSPLAQLTQLTQLHLSSNQITDLSPLAQLTQLTQLGLWNNQITHIPESLLALNLEITLEKPGYNTRKLFIGENPIQEPPLEIVAQGNEAMRRYFTDLAAQGRGQLNEAKLIIVGEPEAGKSTLMECLLDPHYTLDPTQESTMGIDVKAWSFPHPHESHRKMRANIWDFGGQQIQYMTHQFFLTPDSLYLLVITNDRQESKNLPYWFKTIHLLGEKEGRYSPVLVIKNKKGDQFHFDFDEATYKKRYPKLHIEVIEIDLLHRLEDFETAKTRIMTLMSALPLVNDDRPAQWEPIRQSLAHETRNHITFETYAAICARHKVDHIESQKLLSRYLHHSGSLLHFVEDIHLRDFMILNPQWAVDAVYSVLGDTTIAQHQGKFTLTMLEKLWHAYTPHEQKHLLDLMKKESFEICYPLNNDPNVFIAPQLLPTTQPRYTFDAHRALTFRFSYTFMPEGIITRLIVRLSRYLKEELVWKKGMILQNDHCIAKVVEDESHEGLKMIEIQVNGGIHQRKYFLHIIREEVKEIHRKWFKNIAFHEMVPCCCSECAGGERPYFFAFSTLEKYQQKKKSTIECPKSVEDVDVQLLIEGVITANETHLHLHGNNEGIINTGDYATLHQFTKGTPS